MPYALPEFDVLTAIRGARAIRWQYAIYTWPCMAVAAEANRLQLLRSLNTQFIDWRETLSLMLRSGGSPVPHDLLRADPSVADRGGPRTGRVFDGLSPDYHSGVLFAHLAGKFLSTNVPLSLAGLSGRSNGVVHMRAEQITNNPIAREFARLNERAGFTCHPDLPDCGFNSATIVGLDPLFRRRRLFRRILISAFRPRR